MKKQSARILGTILALMILAIIGGVFYLQYKNSKSNNSNNNPIYSPTYSNPAGSSNQPSPNSQSTDINKLLQTAQNYYQQKKYSNAENTYKQVLATEPNNTVALLGLGNVYRDWGKTDLAITEYNKVIQIDAHNISAYINLSQIYKGRNQIDKAKEVLNNGLKNNPGNSSLQNSLDILEIEPNSAEGR